MNALAEWTSRRVHVDAETGFSVMETVGMEQGPTLAVLAGIHGDEPSAVAAASLVKTTLPRLARGRLVLVPICNELAWRAAQRRSPGDDRDLARSFGGGTGTTAALAAKLLDEVIARADALIDLHTARPRNDMAFLVGYVAGSPPSSVSRMMAEAFRPDVLWIHDESAPGRTVSVALDRGIPTIYTEGPGGGAVDSELATRYARGVIAVARAFALVPGASSEALEQPAIVGGNDDLDRVGLCAEVGGLFVRNAVPGEAVSRGGLLGRVVDPLDSSSAEVRADVDGVVVLLARESSVTKGSLLAVVAPFVG